jgi:hypothetical protein
VLSHLPESDDGVSPHVSAALLLAASERARHLCLPHPTVDQILKSTEATRSRAYEVRDALISLLPSLHRRVGRPAATPVEPTLDELRALVSISQSVTRFVMQHPGCVSGVRRLHYTDTFRHHVIELRAKHPAVPLARIADAACVPLETLEDWLRTGVAPIARDESDAESGDERVTVAQRLHIQTVITQWQTWSGTFVDFCTHLKSHCHVPYGATMVGTILASHGLRTPRLRDGRSPDERALRNAFKVFFSNAQWVGDGSAVAIVVNGERFVFNLELLVDAYSDAFVGATVSDEEDSRAVVDALLDAKETTIKQPIAVLLDNKPSNHTPEVDAALGETLRIRATSERPQNKAHVEGGFGLFKSTAPPLVVVGATGREIAESVLRLAITTFFRAANHRPRADRGGRSRVQINADTATLEQIDEARRALNEICRRQELAHRTLEARQNPEVRAYLDRVFDRIALLDPTRSVRVAIARYPLDAIVDAVAIFEGKRAAGTLPPDADARYLLAIARNIAAVNEGARVTEALLRERMAQRDYMLAALEAERLRVLSDPSTLDMQLKAFADRACEVDAVLDRRYWLLVIVDVIRSQTPARHAELATIVSRRIHATFRIRPHERREAVRFILDRVVPLH